jgi:hypothetical protein
MLWPIPSMNFDTVNSVPCIPGIGSGGSGSGSVPTDPRCSDATFAAANPNICGSTAYLILKPASSIITVLGSVQFNTFLYQNGVESQLSSNLLFGSSDTTIFVIGASSGNGTGIAPGEVVVTVTYQGMSATAVVTVVDSSIGCKDTVVATAIVIDNSISMSQLFGGPYKTKLDFAKAVALAYSGAILQVNGQPKDSVSIFNFNDSPNQVSTGFISDTTLLATQINSITQSQGDTDLSSAIKAATTALQATTASELVMLIISDGQQTDTPTEQDVLNAASTFTSAGGIIMCIGSRANGTGFDLLERAATGGFFLNAIANNAADTLGGLSYLKSALCAGACYPAGDFYAASGELDYSSFLNWSVISGQVNLLGNGFLDLLPGNGLYVELAENNHQATLQSIEQFTLNPGDTYDIQFDLAGNNETYTPSAGQAVRVYIQDVNSNQILLDHTVSPNWNSPFQTQSFSFTANYAATVRIYFQQLITAGFTGSFAGNLIDNIVFSDTTSLVTLFEDDFDEENIEYSPPACGPSAALPALADPLIPSLMFLNYFGGSQLTGETYKYAISYKTQQGETNLSPVASTASLAPVSFPNQATLLSNLAPNPLVYPPDRILAIRIWRNDVSASSTMYLLATITPENINYIDLLDHAQFAAILNSGITPPVSNTTTVAQGAIGFGLYGCYEPVCEPKIAVGSQYPDPNPLANIEATGGGGGGGQFNSHQQACGTCPNSGINFTSFNFLDLTFGGGSPFAFPASVGVTNVIGGGSPNAAVFGVLMNNAGLPTTSFTYEIDYSNDGITWTSMASGTVSASQFFSIPYFPGVGNPPVPGVIGVFIIPLAAGPVHTHYRLVAGSGDPNTDEVALAMVNFSASSSNPQICKSATATSYISQQDADSKALAAAQQQLNAALAAQCINAWVSTKSYTANCPCGEYGQPQTATGVYTSLVSQADADAGALAAAQAAATAALNCTLSDSGQQIVVTDLVNWTLANIYPSVEYVSGFVGNSSLLVVTLTGVTFGNGGDFVLVLVSPTGKLLILVAGACSGTAQPSPVNWVFEDSAGSQLPQNSAGPSGNYKVSDYNPAILNQNNNVGCLAALYAACGGAKTTLNQMTGDSPNGSWSLWCFCPVAHGFAPLKINSWTLTIT